MTLLEPIDQWEESWRLARTPKHVRFLDGEAIRRGQERESLIGLLRSTYPKGDLGAAPDTQAAENGVGEASGALVEGGEPQGGTVGVPGSGDTNAEQSASPSTSASEKEWWE